MVAGETDIPDPNWWPPALAAQRQRLKQHFYRIYGMEAVRVTIPLSGKRTTQSVNWFRFLKVSQNSM